MHGASVAIGLMAHRRPSLPAVFGHELPGYLAPSPDMSRLPSRRLEWHHATMKPAPHRCHAWTNLRVPL